MSRGTICGEIRPRSLLKWLHSLYRPAVPEQVVLSTRVPARTLGRSQAVRQRILIPPFGGSIPPAPATQSLDLRVWSFYARNVCNFEEIFASGPVSRFCKVSNFGEKSRESPALTAKIPNFEETSCGDRFDHDCLVGLAVMLLATRHHISTFCLRSAFAAQADLTRRW